MEALLESLNLHKLRVMEALLGSLTIHKGNEKVVEGVAFALKNICINGTSFVVAVASFFV